MSRTSKLAIGILATAGVVALTIWGLASRGDEPGPDPGSANPSSQAGDYAEALADAPPPLARLYANGDQVLEGGLDRLHDELAGVRGYPVVVNVWASWCGPCRAEFPDFQRVAAKRGHRIAFIGVDTNDATAAANEFLDELPLPYPSVSDPDSDYYKGELDVIALPSTAFYNAAGELVHVKQGPYTSAAELNADIDKYAS